MVITFEEFRKVKDSLPHGSMQMIADRLGLDVETVRNYFGGTDYVHGNVSGGVAFEKGPNGGLVRLDDTAIYDCAIDLLKEQAASAPAN